MLNRLAVWLFLLVLFLPLGATLPVQAQISKVNPGANRRNDLKLTQFFSIKLANVTTVSQNVTFGFFAEKVMLRTIAGNTDEICVDYLQSAAAACPAANTSGNGRIPAGTSLVFDNFVTNGISVIAASGTQTIYVDAWN